LRRRIAGSLAAERPGFAFPTRADAAMKAASVADFAYGEHKKRYGVLWGDEP
jgi:hypothetical protein